MRISFILLAHEAPDVLEKLIVPLLRYGSDIFLHYDKSSPHDIVESSKNWRLNEYSGNLYIADSVKVSWGGWSIVQATLNCLFHARNIGYNADYFMLLSGSCMPIKPIDMLKEHISKVNNDYIESVNAVDKKWVVDGLQEDRWKFYHFFNWRSQPKLFSLSYRVQSLLGIDRKVPSGFTPYIGSQWWCLRRSTIDNVLALIDQNKDFVRFYKKTWIPDESFFQTLVANLVPKDEISFEALTHYEFNSAGVPRIFFDDDLLDIVNLNGFFLRKVSNNADNLKETLGKIVNQSPDEFEGYVKESNSQLKQQSAIAYKGIVKEIEVSRKGLATSKPVDKQYLQGMECPILVFCSSNIETRRRLSNFLKNDNRFQYFGEIFGEASRFCGDFENNILSQKASNVHMANHFWLSTLCELLNGKKPVALILGSDAKDFIGLLKWKKDCCIVLVESNLDENNFSHQNAWSLDDAKKEKVLFLDIKLSFSKGYADIYETSINNQSFIDNILFQYGGENGSK